MCGRCGFRQVQRRLFPGEKNTCSHLRRTAPVYGSSARSDNFESKFTARGTACGALSPPRPQKSTQDRTGSGLRRVENERLGLLGVLGRIRVDGPVEVVAGKLLRDVLRRRLDLVALADLCILGGGRSGQGVEVGHFEPPSL